VWASLGYTEKGAAKKLLNKGFVEGKDYILELARSADQASLQHGGQNRQRIMMSVRTFKELCMLAKPTKAEIVRKYYLTMEEVLMTYLKEREADSVLKLMEERAASVLDIERINADRDLLVAQTQHDTFLTAYRGVDIVYIASLIWNDVKYLKIGSCEDIVARVPGLQRDFGKTLMIAWVYPSKKFRDIERSVKRSKKVLPFKHGVPKKDGKLSTETFVHSAEFNLDTLSKIVKHIAHREDSIGPSCEERAMDLAMLQARNTQDALQIRQRELAMAEAATAESQDGR
jgi:phage anti-repressor protein